MKYDQALTQKNTSEKGKHEIQLKERKITHLHFSNTHTYNLHLKLQSYAAKL